MQRLSIFVLGILLCLSTGCKESTDNQGTDADAWMDGSSEDTVPVDDTGESDSTEDTAPVDVSGEVDSTDDNGETTTHEACALDAVTDTVDLVGEHVIGDFTVELNQNGGISVSHPIHGGEVWADAGGAFFHGAQASLHVEEHQGSFDISEDIGSECSELTLSAAVWHSDAGLRVTGYFGDCEDTAITIDLCQPDNGQLRVAVSAPELDLLKLRTGRESDERFYGLGEQFPHDTLNLDGREIPVLAQEGGVGRGHEPISTAVNLYSEGSAGNEDTSYAPMAHYLTSELRSIVLENTELAIFDFTDEDEVQARVYTSDLAFRVLAGDSPKGLIERLTAWSGRMPALPEWVGQGAIVALAGDLDNGLEIVDELLEHDVAISGVWNQTWSGTQETWVGEQVLWNWVQNSDRHPGWDDWVTDLNNRGIRTLCYVNPMFVDPDELEATVDRNLYDEAIEGGYLVERENGEPYLIEVTAFEVGLLDLGNDDARAWMSDVLIDEVIGAGCSGWMADFAEALPFDAVLGDGVPAATWHNRYPVEWARLNREAVEGQGLLGEVVFFSRAGHTQTPGQALLMWEGDQLTTWDKYDGLVSALYGLIGGGLSGISLNHSDIGGYTSLSYLGLGYDREAEQLVRWAEMSAFTAVMRTHQGNQPDANAQVYDDDDSMEAFGRMTRVYRALADYRADLMIEAETTGVPLVRHLLLEFPDDPESWEIDDQFMLGSDLLVAPIKNKCWTWPLCPYNKEMYLPPGEWIHLWTGDSYGDSGSGSWITVQADLGEPAVFYRAGSAAAANFIENLNADGFELPEGR